MEVVGLFLCVRGFGGGGCSDGRTGLLDVP